MQILTCDFPILFLLEGKERRHGKFFKNFLRTKYVNPFAGEVPQPCADINDTMRYN